MPGTLSIAEGLQALAAKVENTNPHAGKESILFVEDNELILEIGATILTELGYNVKTAVDAATAVQVLVDGFEPSLMCCDIVLPGGMNGVELARQVAELMPSVKVLLMSGYGAGMMDDTVNQDGFRLLSKPYTSDELGSRVRHVLDGTV